MSHRAHIDQRNGVTLPREALAEAGLRIGDALVIDHVEPGLIRLRKSEPTTWSEVVERYGDNESVDELEELLRDAEEELADQLVAKLEVRRRDG